MLGQVFVVADQDTNSLLVTTATKYEDDVHENHRPSWIARCRRC